MANSPVLFGPNNTAINLQNQVLQGNGTLLAWNGPKNYIGYSSFQGGLTTGWSLGTVGALTNNIPSGSPTFGSGASGNLSIAATSTTPLASTYSLSLVSAAATTSGDMLASDALAIDLEDQAKVLTFKFYYSPTSNPTNGNWSGTISNSFGVACYDVTNSSWLPVAGNFSMTQSSGVGIATGTMQTNSTTASVRFIIYNANASAGAITVYFDDFYLGPQTAPIGPVMTDWVAYTPTFTAFGSVTAISFWWRRVGDSAEIEGVFTTGTVTAAEARMSLPPGLTSSGSDKLPTLQVVGKGNGSTPTTTAFGGWPVFAEQSKTYVTFGGETSTTGGVVKANANAMSGSSALQSFFARVPIAGWSSNVQMSNDTDTRVIAALITGNPASATSGNPIIVPTITIDTAGGYNASTGRYTCTVTGLYKVYGALSSASSATTLTIYKNAVSTALAGNLDSNGEATFSSAVSCSAGDIIDLRPGGTVDATDMTLNFERMSGPAVVAATESVNARYYASATSISGSLATIVWTTKDFDSHNAMSSGVYTIPVSGKYQCNSNVQTAGTIALNSTVDVQLQKNGAAVSEFQTYAGGAMTAQNGQISDIISCNAGDTVRIQLSSSATLPTIAASNTKVFFSIARVGN